MIIALARPVFNEKINDIESELNAVVIAIDVSKSMNAIDIYPNRLEFAKNKLLNILDTSKTEAIGVILFAKSSFLLSAITQDFASLKLLINNLDRGINFDNGTNIFSTLETSDKLLKNYTSKNLILLTDGGDNTDFAKEISFANKNNISIYTLALATSKGSAIKESNGDFLTDSKGNIVNIGLNEKIKELSLKTNGGYIDFSLNNDDINQILNDINLKSKKEKFKDSKYKTYTELFYYPLTIGIFLLLIAFSSLPSFPNIINIFKHKSLSILLASLFVFFNTNSNASSVLDFISIKEANKAYENKDYEKASNEFKSLDSNDFRDYNLANSYYKTNNFDKAIDLYKNIQSSNTDLEFKKLHNLANAYANKNDFQNAITNYEEALKLRNDKETKENLELLKEALEKQKNKEENQEKNQNEENKKENKNQEEQQNNDESKKENPAENKEQKENQTSQEKEKKEQKENSTENIDENQKQEMSDYEEKKWIKEIENQKTNSLLKKMESSNENSISNPW